jgi:predicted negative regulator of RcsB-dependent stress response
VAIARLRLAGMLMDAKQYDEALKVINVDLPEEFMALANDRKGDVLLAQGKKDEAAKAYQVAWQAMDATVDYRRFIEGKLTALGSPPTPASTKAVAAGVAPTN